MKEYVFTVDTGTTNTRVILWDSQRKLIGTEKRPVGVRNTAIDGNNNRLKEAVKGCLEALLQAHRLTYDDIDKIIASGMITSNVGLVEIPHLVAPVSVDDLARGIQPVLLADVCPLPVHFIPGMKNRGDKITLENFESMDIMRGEEVESVAILDRFKGQGACLLVLPGSHTKFVSVDAGGYMTGCLTSITGELISSVTNDTIIADAVGRRFVEEDTYDREMLLLGYETAKKTGMGRACFSGRILNQFAVKDKAKLANYIFGVCLQSDIAAIKNSSALRVDHETTVIVAGKNPFRQAIADILTHDGYFKQVRTFQPEEGLALSPIGAYIIADRSKQLNG